MKLAPEELAIISGLVQQYKEMPEEKREAARAFAYNRAIWQGNAPHDREVNKQLYNRFLNADAELRAAQPAEKPAFNPPTMQETIAAARATIAWIAPILVPVAGIAVVGYIAFQALMGLGAAVCAFFTSWGGVLVGLVFVAACLSSLFGGRKGEAVGVETKQEKRGPVNINIVVDGEQKNVNVG